VRLLLILSLQLELVTKQVDYTSAFLHAPIEEEVFVEMPRGFHQPGKVLQLKRSLYGLKQALRNFFEHFRGKLLRLGLMQSQANPCLFIYDNVICLTYVNDCFFFSPSVKYIDEIIKHLEDEGMKLSVEDDMAGFLSIHINCRDDGTIELLQTGLIEV